jgi:hypothetical protein
MRTSFHHQPEAQHPNSSSTSWQADYPIFRGQSGHRLGDALDGRGLSQEHWQGFAQSRRPGAVPVAQAGLPWYRLLALIPPRR